VAAGHVRIGERAPDLVVGVIGNPHARGASVGSVEAVRQFAEPVTATASPDHEPTEALRDQRFEHVLQEPLECVLTEVDVAAVAAMLGCRAERRRRQDERDDAARLETLCDRLAELGGKPGVEIYA